MYRYICMTQKRLLYLNWWTKCIFTLISGINFLHEGHTSLQIKGQWFHQVQVLFHILDNNMAGVAVCGVQHCASTLITQTSTWKKTWREDCNLCTHSYSKVVSIMNNHHIVILFVLALTMAFLSHFQMTNRTFYHFTSVKMDRIWIHFHCNWLTICCVLILEKKPTLSNYFFIFFKDQFKQIALKRLVTRELCFGNGWQWMS